LAGAVSQRAPDRCDQGSLVSGGARGPFVPVDVRASDRASPDLEAGSIPDMREAGT